ncbi:MAG: ABC-F family ATP-binding cassette domain-containing protein [Verrucomicrobiota bacterium]
MLTIKKLSKAVGARTLFEGADLTINYGERAALVGPNGAGKSTLFSLILGTDRPDSGQISRDEWTTLGYLPQESEPVEEETTLQVATGQAGELAGLEKQRAELEAEGQVDVPEYYEAQAKHEALSDPSVEAKAQKMLRGLGFRQSDWERPAKELSGGWVMRAHLARLLVMEPGLLMLDEPTNHLDLMSLLWFQDHLKNYSGALLLISHDREFMDNLVESVHDIDEQKLVHYKGNYSDYLVQRRQNFERAHAAWKNQQKEIKALQAFADKFRSVSSKAAQAQSKLKQLEKMDILEKPRPPRKVFRIQFPQPSRSGQRVISLDDMHMSYGDTKVYKGLDLSVERGERIVLVGPNGAGKTTLLKILAGRLEFQEGKRNLGHNCRIGYFGQHRSEELDEKNSVLEEVIRANPKIEEDEARGVLGSFLFRKEDVFKKVSVLSGGEKSRLNLIKFLVDPPNLLLMDEPTTHLDIISIEALVIALERYEGTLVFISHDVHFIRKLATKVLHISAGEVTPYSGGYDYYLEKTGAEDNARAAVTSGGPLSNEQV